MIGLVATFDVIEGKQDAFEALARDLMARVKASEGGCLTYQLYKTRGSDTRYIMMEEYASEAALTAHTKTAHYAELGGQLGQYLSAKPQLDVFDIVE